MVRLMRVTLAIAVLGLVAQQAAFAQGPGRGRGFGFGMGGGFGGGMMLMNPQVQKELKMSEEQTAKIQEIQQAAFQGGGGFGGGQTLSDEERQKRMDEFRKRMEETNKKLVENLTPEQNARFKQIQLWVGGTASLATNAEAAKELKITDDQKEAFKLISEESGKKMGELFQSGGFGQNASEEDRKKMGEKMAEIRKETETECMAVLTDEQKAQFAKMRGDKFELDMSQGFGFGGRGRRGRPGNNNN